MPYRDPSTGEYRLLQIVSFPDLPDGPDDFNQRWKSESVSHPTAMAAHKYPTTWDGGV